MTRLGCPSPPLRARQWPAHRPLSGLADYTRHPCASACEHLFPVTSDPAALRPGLRGALVASAGPTCSEVLEAHGVTPDLQASTPQDGTASRARRGPRVRPSGRQAAPS